MTTWKANFQATTPVKICLTDTTYEMKHDILIMNDDSDKLKQNIHNNNVFWQLCEHFFSFGYSVA